VKFHNDPRSELKAQGKNYLFAFLHAHQLGMIIGRESGTGAMVSRSKDGELIVPLLKMSGCVPVRGSNRVNRKDRGGMTALHTLVDHVQSGRPAALAVDGPRGPRGRVHKGIALLSQQTGAPVIALVAVAKYRWVATKAWDRMQVPYPFSRIDGYFSEPIFPRAGEKLEAYRQRIEAVLLELEAVHEPTEAVFSVLPSQRINGIYPIANGRDTISTDVEEDESDDDQCHFGRAVA
jgi:lysophospholipid acyltransferase (LPLAT)-like uncharacterized protein